MKIDMEKEMKNQLKAAYLMEPPNNRKFQDTVYEAKRLLFEQSKYKTTPWDLVAMQLKSISKFFWVLQFLCFCFFVIDFSNMREMNSIQTMFLTVSPIMAFYILPELYKSRIYNMAEFEATCLHSPAKNIAIKMILTSISNFTVILTMSLILGIYHQLNIWEILYRGLIPFNVAISIALVLFGMVRIKSPHAMFSVAIVFSVSLAQFGRVDLFISSSLVVLYFMSLLVALLLFYLTIYRLSKVEGLLL